MNARRRRRKKTNERNRKQFNLKHNFVVAVSFWFEK